MRRSLLSKYLLVVCFISSPIQAYDSIEDTNTIKTKTSDNFYDENFSFVGIASIYNNSRYLLLLEEKNIVDTDLDEFQLDKDTALIVHNRYSSRVVRYLGKNQYKFKINDNTFERSKNISVSNIEDLDEKTQNIFNSFINESRYSNLPIIINSIAKFFDQVLRLIQSVIGSWGIAIILLALFMKIILLPIAVFQHKSKLRVDEIKKIVEPKIERIKKDYSGEEAHNKILNVYKDLGISQNYSLLPALLTLIQLPFLIAVFNTLGEMTELHHETFLWIVDLSRPDPIYKFNMMVPMLGNTLNLLPFIMSLSIIFAGFLGIDKTLEKKEVKIKKKNTLLLSMAFLLIFYPFPAAMVLYWTASNTFSAFQQKGLLVYFKRRL